MQIRCWTKFDITATGVTGHYRAVRLPFTDRNGTIINNELSWNRARNQQRNWETLQQILSLRAQLFELTDPIKEQDFWVFNFTVEQSGLFVYDDDPVGILKLDANGVPMLMGLTETNIKTPYLDATDNIGFDIVE